MIVNPALTSSSSRAAGRARDVSCLEPQVCFFVFFLILLYKHLFRQMTTRWRMVGWHHGPNNVYCRFGHWSVFFSFFFRSYYTNILSCLIFLGFYIYDAPSMNDETTNGGCHTANLLWASVGLSGHYRTSSICPPTPVYSLPLSPRWHRRWLGCQRGSLWRRFTHVCHVLLRTKWKLDNATSTWSIYSIFYPSKTQWYTPPPNKQTKGRTNGLFFI